MYSYNGNLMQISTAPFGIMSSLAIVVASGVVILEFKDDAISIAQDQGDFGVAVGSTAKDKTVELIEGL